MKQIKRCDPRVRRKCPDAGFCKGVFMEGSECDLLQSKLAGQVAWREARLIDANKIPYHKSGFSKGDGFDSGLDWSFREDIDELPTVDAAPVVHGRWINWGKSGTPTYENYGTCSVCHEDAEICTEHRNYCPNCGAKMDLEVSHG